MGKVNVNSLALLPRLILRSTSSNLRGAATLGCDSANNIVAAGRRIEAKTPRFFVGQSSCSRKSLFTISKCAFDVTSEVVAIGRFLLVEEVYIQALEIVGNVVRVVLGASRKPQD